VSDGEDFDVITADHIYKVEGKSREDVTTGAGAVARPGTRILRDSVDRVP